MENVPRKVAIVRANRYMVDHTDFLIAYAWHPASNARDLLEYAGKREGKGLMDACSQFFIFICGSQFTLWFGEDDDNTITAQLKGFFHWDRIAQSAIIIRDVLHFIRLTPYQ